MIRRFGTKCASNGFQVCHLPNGIKVASVNTIPGGPFCSTGILVKTGDINARAEPDALGTASSYVLEKLAFKETQKISPSEMQKRLDGLVGSAMSKSNREFFLVSAAIIPEQAEEVLSLMRSIAQDTVVTRDDLEEMKSVVAYDLEALTNKPEELIPEMVHGPAFYADGACGNSILSVQAALERLRVEDVYEFRQRAFSSGNVYAAAAGVPHDVFTDMATRVFGSDPALQTHGESKTSVQYRGGESYSDMPQAPLIHIGIGFQGLAAGHRDAYAQAVLQMLLGGGGSFSAGGPGKGMYSRLYTQVLNRHHWIESAKVFCHAYSGTGLFGIHGSALPSHARELALVILGQMTALVQSPISAVEFARAKAQVRSAVLMGLESRMTQLEDLGDQLSHRSEAALESPAEICAKIDAVQLDDLQRVAKTILSSGRPSVVAYGPLSKMPSYTSICDWAAKSF